MKILGKIPTEPFMVACSGGMDSMVLIDFLTHYPQNRFEIAFFNHGTRDCENAQKFLVEWCAMNGLKLNIGVTNRKRQKQESLEEYWRNQRYEFLDKFDCPVLTAHHLDDVVESWVMSSIKGGNPRLIPYRRNRVIRPFLLVSKSEITDWVSRNNLSYVSDLSNDDVSHLRNYVRHIMMPHILHLNPGIHKMIRRKISKENEEL